MNMESRFGGLGWVLLLGLVPCACSSSSAPAAKAGADTGSDSGSAGQFGFGQDGTGEAGDGAALHVVSVATLDRINDVFASNGTFYFTVDFILQNTDAVAPLSTSFTLLSLVTDQGLVISAAADQPSGPCDDGISVAEGGHIECNVAFEVPTGQKPQLLAYGDSENDQTTAELPSLPAPSAACTTVAGWASAPDVSTSCSGCIGGQGTGGSPCQPQGTAYFECTTCSGDCDLDANGCVCERGCDSTTCQALFDALQSCIASQCAASCP